MSNNDRLDAISVPDAARRRTAIQTLDRAWAVARTGNPNATANDVVMLLSSMSTLNQGPFLLQQNIARPDPATTQVYRDALAIHNGRNNILTSLTGAPGDLLRRRDLPAAPAAPAAPATPRSGWNVPRTINFAEEVYHIGPNVRGERPNHNDLAAGFLTHWNGNRNDGAVRDVLMSVKQPGGNGAYVPNVVAVLYERYQGARAAGRNEEAEVVGDALAYFRLRAVFRQAQQAGETMERPNFDRVRQEAINIAQQRFEGVRVGSSQQQALNEFPFTQRVFADRQTLVMPDLERRQQAVAALDRFYNNVNSDSNRDNDITFGQALANIENAKRSGNSGHSNRALDDATRILRRQQEIEAANPEAASQAVRIRTGVTDPDGRPANPAARGPVSLRGPNVDAMGQALLELVPTPGHRDAVRQRIGAAQQAGGATDDPAVVMARLHRELVATPESDAAQRTQLTQAIGVVYRVADIEMMRQANRESTPPIDYRDSAQYTGYLTRAGRFARAAAENNEALANENRPGNGAPAAASAGGPAADGVGAGGSGSRARRWALRDGTPAPAENEMPGLADNQVQRLQQLLKAAGQDIGSTNDDGKYGPKTHAALRRFAASLTPPVTDLSTIDFSDLSEGSVGKRVNDALREAAGRNGGAAPAAPGAGASAPAAPAASAGQSLRTRFAAEIARVQETNSTPVRYHEERETRDAIRAQTGVTDQVNPMIESRVNDGIRTAAVQRLQSLGVQLQADQLTVGEGGVISSPIIRQIETALGLAVVDGNWDRNLQAVLEVPAIRQAIAQAVNDGSIARLASASEPAAPGATPGNGTGPATGR